MNRALQEMIKQLSVGNKEKGYMMLKIFRKVMEESEKKWFKVIENLTKYSLKLKADVEFLLGKFFSKPDIQTVMENNNPSMENLAEHKRLLQISVGAFFSQESQRIEAEKKTSLLEEEVNRWVLDWSSIRKSSELVVFASI